MCVPIVYILAPMGVIALALLVAVVMIVRALNKSKGGPA